MIDIIPLKEAVEHHWYLRVNGSRESGPYSFMEVLSMLETGDLKFEDEATYRGLGGWHPITSFANFNKDEIKRVLDEQGIDPTDNDEIPFRRSVRIPISSEVMVVIEDRFFKGEVLDLSTGGCLLRISKGKVKTDDVIKIHFYENTNANLLAFNAGGGVVRAVSEEKVEHHRSSTDLVGIKFNPMKKEAKDDLRLRIRDLVLSSQSNQNINQIIKRNSIVGM